MKKIHIIDSHTGGEPTRVIIGGDQNSVTAAWNSACVFREQFDHYRSATVCEPRGSDVIVGALHCETSHPDCVSGVIFSITSAISACAVTA
jgi:4-hydroxyproline epimerase